MAAITGIRTSKDRQLDEGFGCGRGRDDNAGRNLHPHMLWHARGYALANAGHDTRAPAAHGSIHRAFAIGRNWRTVASFALLGRGLLKLRSPPAEKGEGEVQPPTAKEDSVFSLRLDDVERKLPRERHIRARIQ